LYTQGNGHVSTLNPDHIEATLSEYLQQQEIEPLVNQSKYKMNFDFPTKDEQVNKIQVKLCKHDKGVTVEFMNLNGDKMNFYDIVKDLKTVI
jgi:hypothetical protein